MARDLPAGEVTDRVPVVLIELEDGGVDGRRIGCGDSAVPVELDLPYPQPALEGALAALLEMDERFDRRTGLYHPLHASRLKIERIERNGPEVRVHLQGYLEIGGDCDGSRVLAQLRETALQFSDVQRATFLLEGRPLQPLLQGRGK